MAKRKAARATGRKRTAKRGGANRSRSRAAGAARRRKSAARKSRKNAARRGAARKSAARKSAARKSAARKSTARKSTARKSAARKSTARKSAARKSAARKSTARKSAARKSAARKSAARKDVRKVARKAAVPKAPRRRAGKAAAPKSPARAARSVRSGGKRTTILASVRKVPALDRERRVISDDDLFPMPPSSLNPASSARTERREVVERFHDQTETSPALTGGDVDADWVNIYVAGDDEARGGDDPTPGQDVVDDIGKSIGVQHEDTEELKSEAKLSDRDKKRSELDPASAEDDEDR